MHAGDAAALPEAAAGRPVAVPVHAAGLGEGRGHVVAAHAVILKIEVRGPVEIVPTRLDREVQQRAGPRVLPHVARRPEFELLVAAEVEIRAVAGLAVVGADALDIGDVPHGDAVGAEARLRTDVRAAHVDALHLEARRERHRAPNVTGRWDRRQRLPVEARSRGGALDVHDRRLSHDSDLFGDPAGGQRRVHRERPAQREPDPLVPDGLETREFEGH